MVEKVGDAENRRTDFFLLCVCVRMCVCMYTYAVVPVLCLNLSAALTLRSILQQWAGDRKTKIEEGN